MTAAQKKAPTKPHALFLGGPPGLKLLARPEGRIQLANGLYESVPPVFVHFRPLTTSIPCPGRLNRGIAKSWCSVEELARAADMKPAELVKHLTSKDGHGMNYVYVAPDDELQSRINYKREKSAPRHLPEIPPGAEIVDDAPLKKAAQEI